MTGVSALQLAGGSQLGTAAPLQQFPCQAGVQSTQAKRPVRHYARDGAGLRRVTAGGKFHGVGPATAAKIQRLGIQTGADLRKSSGSQATFAHGLTEAEIQAGVVAMADEVWVWCENANAFGRTVTVKVKFVTFRSSHAVGVLQ
jgi:nucleotidyltransferase/DNA polymerase involved in DNA repair